jgi:hypothetical protein
VKLAGARWQVPAGGLCKHQQYYWQVSRLKQVAPRLRSEKTKTIFEKEKKTLEKDFRKLVKRVRLPDSISTNLFYSFTCFLRFMCLL